MRCLLPVAVLLLFCAGSLAAAEAELAPLADRALLLDGQVIDSRLVAVGERGHILVSTDSGRSWQQSPVPTQVTLTSVYFVDDQSGWAAGHDATILRTKDGGATWQIVYSDPDLDAPILDLWFRDADYGLAVGAYGLILITTDGGDSWQQEPLSVARGRFTAKAALLDDSGTPGVDLHLNHLHAAPSGQLFLAGEGGHLYRSDDGGRSWSLLSFPYDGSLFGTLSLDTRRILAFGLRGHLFLSTDAGSSWLAVATGTDATLNDAVLLDDARIVVAGLAGVVLLGGKEAKDFTLHAQPDRAGFARILVAPDGTLVLLGNQGARRLELPGEGGHR